jgi:hypothetical protein
MVLSGGVGGRLCVLFPRRTARVRCSRSRSCPARNEIHDGDEENRDHEYGEHGPGDHATEYTRAQRVLAFRARAARRTRSDPQKMPAQIVRR